MQQTSLLYQRIYMSQNYWVETALAIGEAGRLITEKKEILTFGGDSILVSSSGADAGYGENLLISLKTSRRIFASDKPQVGCCTCGEICVEMIMPLGDFPPQAMLAPFVRLVSTEDGTCSEWIRKGIFYVDSRSNTRNEDDLDILRIHGYDAMMRANKPYELGSFSFPATDKAVVQFIAEQMGISVDSDSLAMIDKSYTVREPYGYTLREILGYIGAMYAGNWIINDLGALQLVCLNSLPPETSLLVDEKGFRLMFADDRILV